VALIAACRLKLSVPPALAEQDWQLLLAARQYRTARAVAPMIAAEQQGVVAAECQLVLQCTFAQGWQGYRANIE